MKPSPALLLLVLAQSSCALVAGIDDVHLVEDSSVAEDTAPFDTAFPFDTALDVTREDDTADATSDVFDTTGVIGDANDADDGTTGPSCPATAHGGGMALITAPGSVYYCIDTHEVTNEQFNEYLADITLPFDSHPACAPLKASTRPSPKTTPAVAKRPVNGINYCYAWAYCRWAGRRLCGKIGGGHADSPGDTITNEWYYACANGLKESKYPYGDTYVAGTCNSDFSGTFSSTMLVDVGSKTSCHGNDPGHDLVFDMSGNVWEFDDFATSYAATGPEPSVHSHGGSATDGATDGACGTNNSFGMGTDFSDVGFRCCGDAK